MERPEQRAKVASEETKTRRKHRWLLWTCGALLLLLVALGVLVAISLRRAEPMLREVIVEKLQEHFHARVQLDSFHISLAHGLWAEGKGLRIWPPAQVAGVSVPGPNGDSVPASTWPLIRLDEFQFHAPLHYDPHKPIRISVVQLKGLDIDVPPKTHFSNASTSGDSNGRQKKISSALMRFEIDKIECSDAHLELETSKPGKLPLEFDIAQIRLSGVSAAGAMPFDADLTSPRPAGLIKTSGTVGPWAVDDPGETPVAGNYRFEHADLGVFKGIAGILDSSGKYQGVLRNIDVDGETETPDFRLTHFGTAMPLRTHFHAMVDGTDGDTQLQPVDAVLGRSHFTVEGQIVRSQAVALPKGGVRPAGHDIDLRVNVDHGRMEDFLRLTSKSGAPLLTGDLILRSTLEIPPGKEPVHERMKLNGKFLLDDAEFTSEKIQTSVEQLSLRGQGESKEAKEAKHGAEENNDVRSAMQSDFKMARGVINLPDLKYTVPGAEVDVAGKYGVEGSTLDFAGTARTDATVSQMVGGWKGFLLKPADRFFKKDGAGTEVPIHINGTREDPKFGIDVGRIKHTHPATPGDPK